MSARDYTEGTRRCHIFGHKWDSFLTDRSGRAIRVCRRKSCNRWERALVGGETPGTGEHA
jgi:hypothetical protein